MKILFITATRIGDCVLSMGALAHFIRLYPSAEITVACGPLVAGFFTPIAPVKKIIVLKKEPYAGHWVRLAQATLGKRWDIVIDLRNSLLSRLLLADKKYIWSAPDKKKHKVEQIADLIGAIPPPSPRIWFDEKSMIAADAIAPPGGPIIAVCPTAASAGKMWPRENFIALLERLTGPDGILPQARIAVIAAPGEENIAKPVLEAFPASRRIDVIAKGAPLIAAAVIKKAALYIGNDSGLTHVAAAVGVPTLGLFGPGWPEQYRPWGPNAGYVSTPETAEQIRIAHGPGKYTTTQMTTLTVDMAYDAAVKLWRKTQP